MKIAIFPGSFDPFTCGHKDIVRQSLSLFDKLIIAVGYNSSKRGFLTVEDRVEVIENSISDLKREGANVEVISYTGLTIDACANYGASFIVRGVRGTADFEMESVIAQANKKINPNISTLFLTASLEYSYISSTIVRDIVLNGGDPKGFICEGIDIRKYLK